MLISETVIWDMLTNAFTPASRATAAMVTVAPRDPAGGSDPPPGACHLGHVDQRVHSGFPRHGRHGYGCLEVPGGYGHAEVDPAAAADDAIDITRFEAVA